MLEKRNRVEMDIVEDTELFADSVEVGICSLCICICRVCV